MSQIFFKCPSFCFSTTLKVSRFSNKKNKLELNKESETQFPPEECF